MRRKLLIICATLTALIPAAMTQNKFGDLTINLADTVRDKKDLLLEMAFFKRETELGLKNAHEFQIISGIELAIIIVLIILLIRKKR